MIIDSKQYGGKCTCGREHEIITKFAVIEEGCLADFDKYLADAGVTGKRCAVYDINTYEAKGLIRPFAEQEIILDSKRPHADEKSTDTVIKQLRNDIKVLVAVGSGTIHDVTRFCAKKLNLKFISVPTAASVDGFCSTIAAMTWAGYKKTMPAVAPDLVIADIDVIRQAPMFLTLSGIGDILGKYTALADWRIAHEVNGEFFCPIIYQVMRDAVNKVKNSCKGVLDGDPGAYTEVMYGLLMSGLAMQMMGNSRPASGSEHHISHIIETRPVALNVHSEALHGEKVGVGTILACNEYHRLGAINDIAPYIKPYEPIDMVWLRGFFGDRLFPSAYEENKNDCLVNVAPGAIIEHWGAIRSIIGEIPTGEEIYNLFKCLGSKKTLEDIEVSSEKLPMLLDYSPLIRNRLTLMRMRRMIKA